VPYFRCSNDCFGRLCPALLDLRMSFIDNDFDDEVKRINLKIKEAAEALKEANKIAKEAGIGGISSFSADEGMYDVVSEIDFDPLFDQLNDAGWSTSSMECPNW
jgi:hypothetical protein